MRRLTDTMMTNPPTRSMYTKAALALAAFAVALMPYPAHAQDVVLNPGYISGNLAVNGETVTQAYVYASWTDPATGTPYSASTSVSGGGSYTLTVNVPTGSTPSYNVSASLYLSNYQFYLTPPSQTVAVTAFATSTANFEIDPGRIAATVTPTSGSVNSVQIYAYGNGSSVNAYGSGASITLPVVPGDPIYVYGTAYFTAAGYVSLDTQVVSVDAGETVAVSWTVTPPAPAETGTLSGTFTFTGATPSQVSISPSCPNYGSATLAGNGAFSIPNLNVGVCYLSAYAYFNNYTSFLSLPDASFSPDRFPTITSGGTTVDISGTASFISGKLKLTGTKTLSQASSASISASGVQSTSTSGGSASTSVGVPTGDYSLILTAGSWTLGSLNVNFSESSPSAYLQENLYFYDAQLAANPIAVPEAESVTRNLTYGIGTVTINYSVVGGGLLSYPNLNGYCVHPGTNTSYSFYSYGNQTNVTQGSVTFAGMAGTCTVEAWAQVGGSNTKFGSLSVEVVPGTDVVVDLGGPALTVTFPAAGYITSDASISVTGSASDDVAVTDVTVNGTPATLTPAGPATPVSFAAPLALNLGPNQIVTIATDSSGKVSSDTRTVYRDHGPPTLSWTPADQSTSNVAGVTILGTAGDDAGVASVTVNGIVVFESSDPNSGPTDQPFSLPFTLALGDNYIEVVATDIAGQLTAQTHKVTFNPIVADTVPPVITVPADITVNATSGDGADVTYTATAEDPGHGPVPVFCAPPTPDTSTFPSTSTFPIGETTVLCQADDAAGNHAEKTFKVTVTPPDITVTSITIETRQWNGHVPSNSQDAVNTYFSLPLGNPGYAPGPKTLTIFDHVGNFLTFGGPFQNIGYHHHFSFNAPLDGPIAVRIGADFGGGGTLIIDGVEVQFRNTDMWWAGNYDYEDQYLYGLVNITAGPHTIDSYGFEGCCDGIGGGIGQQAQYSYLGGPFTIFTAPANEVPVVSLTGPANIHAGSTHSYDFSVVDADEGSTFSVTAISCGTNGSQVGAATTNAAGGSFECSFSAQGASTVSVLVTDNLGAQSNLATLAVTIDKHASVTVVTCDAGPFAYTGSAHTPCTATVTGAGGLNEPLSVVYTDNVNAGGVTASAVYAGGATHAGSDDSETFVIDQAGSTTVVSCPSNVGYTGAARTPCTVTVTTTDGLSPSVAVIYANNVEAGTATASAAYDGDANHAGSDDSQTFTIDQAPTSSSIGAPAITYAANGVVTVTVSSAAGPVIGTVSLSVDGGAAQSQPLSAGVATFTLAQPSAGNHTLSASFAAQGNFAGSTATGSLQVNIATTATTLTSSPNPSSQGQQVTLTATVSAVAPGSGTPNGTVTFKDGATVLGTAAVNGSGQAVLQTSTLALGPRSLTATYGGSSNYAGSQAATSHLVFAYATGGTFVIGDLNSAVGTQVTFWGAQWANLNSLSGGQAPSSFKGFANAANGGTWQSNPGNSSNPPASVPTYLAVLITSSATKSGSTISGNVVGIAIVRTNAGYAGNPGHAGTGTIVAVMQ